MNAWVVITIWFFLYLATFVLVPRTRLNRGWITRYVLAKVIPIKSLWRPGDHTCRYWLWLGTTTIIDYTVLNGKGEDNMKSFLFWGVYIIFLLDDYINGEDDPKERWEKLKNAVKWKWLPSHDPHPIKETA